MALWFVLVIFVFMIRGILLECQLKPTSLLIEEYDGITKEFLIWRSLVDSKMDCLKKCFFDTKCVTFQKGQDGSCSMYAATLNVLKNWRNGTELGVITAQLPWTGFLGSECITDEDCLFPNSECRNATCGCIFGYSFNPMENACTHGCTTFSNSYTIFPGVGLMNSNLDWKYVDSVEDCQDFCSTRLDCKSFDYLQDNNCYIKSIVVFDDPSQFHQTGYVLAHGVRNCYN